MPRIDGRRRWHLPFVLVTVGILGGAGLYLAWPRFHPDDLALASAAYGRGEWAEASTLAERHLKAVPKDREALRIVARTAARQGRDALVKKTYARLGGASAMEAEDYYLIGLTLERAGHKETARASWENGLRADPTHPELLSALSQAYLDLGRFTPATRLAKRLAERPGWERRAELLQGRIAADHDDPEGALPHLTQGLEPNGKAAAEADPASLKLLARTLLRTGRPAEAQRPLQTILAAGADPEASWLMSRSWLQAGDKPAALDALARGGAREKAAITPEPAPFVGSARCGECHRAVHQTHQDSLHTHTLRRGAGLADLPYPDHPLVDPAKPEVRHTISRSDSQTRYEVRGDQETYRALVDYAIGSGRHGLTLIGRDEKGQPRELRLSRYSEGPVWDLTSGQSPQPPPHEGYLGRLLTDDDVHLCLYCHTTTPRSVQSTTGPESSDRGIGCERCHGPGGNHVKAVASGFPDLAIPWSGKASGASVVALCAQCHSPFAREVSQADPASVRFPGTTLTWSRCYSETRGNLDCVTCHDPHRDAETSPAFYESICLTCHARPKPAPGTTLLSEGPNPCPVNPTQGCLPCHMPSTRTTIPHSRFTDHHIRIHPPSTAESPHASSR